jgi:hypothetical protein
MTRHQQLRQLTMLGVSTAKEETFHIFHDESGSGVANKKERFQFHGALFVPESKWKSTLDTLGQARDGFTGRIHFKGVRDHKQGSGQACRNWLTTYFNALACDCPFKCMVIDTASPGFHADRFDPPFRLYNYAAQSAIFGGIIWSLKDFHSINLHIYSDTRDRSDDDNFAIYLPNQVLQKVNQHPKAPRAILKTPRVVFVPSEPTLAGPEYVEHSEFIQLTDLLTSCVAEAINAGATKEIKLNLAKYIAGQVADVRLPPWLQEKQLHRRFSVSCYPSPEGKFYDCSLAVVEKDQMRFAGM